MKPLDWFILAFAIGMGWHMAYTAYSLVVDLSNCIAKYVSVAYHRYMHKRMCRKLMEVQDGHEIS